MSLHYLLDGYNIIKQMPRLSLKKLEDARGELVNLIEIFQPQGSCNNQITIVFDGQEGIAYGQKSATAKVLFSQNETADDKIKRIVSNAVHKKNIVLVTDDKELKLSVRAAGAKILSVKDFVSKLRGSKIGALERDNNEKHISETTQYKITSEFKKIWLRP